jgi:hypothetical protein
MRARSIILAVAFFSGAFPSSAVAQRCVGEDVAAIDQYCETVLGAEGEEPISGTTKTLRSTLPAALRRLLERAGPEGRALLSLPQGSPLARSDGMRLSRLPGAMAAVRGELSEDAEASGVPARALGSVAAGDGLSGVFRWAILLSTLSMVGIAWSRHRS